MKTLKIACTALILLAGVFAAACSTDPETEAADRVEIDGLDDGLHFPYYPEESASFHRTKPGRSPKADSTG